MIRVLSALLLLSALCSLLACGSATKPPTAKELGQPAPTASTSAEPLWIRNTP